MKYTDTICAIATPAGSGGIAVIRISGDKAFSIIDKIFVAGNKNKKAYSISYGNIMKAKEVIDDVLVSVFKNPHSYTGEDVVEISCHGSTYIQQQIIQLLIENGARTATPGEFTMRAFMNGKMDLSQAEAVADLISTSNEASHRLAINQMRGGFSKELDDLRGKLLHFISMIELELDFGEEDVEFADRSQLLELIQDILKKVKELTGSFRLGNVIKNGIPVAIIGDTNVGKSTLLNVLLNDDKAIVSDIPGTTRDVIEDVVNIDGVGFRFIDTAGIRNTKDLIETMGIERTWAKMEQASVVLYMCNAGEEAEKVRYDIQEIKDRLQEHQQLLVLINKTDLFPESELTKSLKKFDHLVISAKHKTNIQNLKEILVKKASIPSISSESVIVTNSRHYEALVRAEEALIRIQDGINNGIPEDMLTSDIREVLNHIGEITGHISNDEILGNIFKNFCIGK